MVIIVGNRENGKLCIFQDYQKLNSQTKKDPFPLHFLDSVLDEWLDMRCIFLWMGTMVIIK